MTIDFHSHILPGADHGSENVATTMKQLSLMRAAGTDAAVATPHFYPHSDTAERFLARRDAAVARLLDAKRENTPTLYLGAEVLVCPHLEELEELPQLTVSGTKVILLEMPFVRWGNALLETVLAIRDKGFTPVLAHIDRYERTDVQKLLDHGILAQVNAESLVHGLAKRRNRAYLETLSVVALGSDLHGAEADGYRNFIRMREKLGDLTKEIFARTERLLEGALPIG